MASRWTTYSPRSSSTQDVISSNLADNSHTVPSDLETSDAREMAHVLGRVGPNPSVTSIVPFTLTDGPHAESSTSKAAPILVSATSIGFELQEDGSPTLTSVDIDSQQTSAPLPAPLSSDAGQHSPTSEGTEIAAARLVGSILPTHEQIFEPLSPSSSSMFERTVLASHPTKGTQAAAPISAAGNATPPSPSNSAPPYPITTGDIITPNFPTTGAPRSPTVNPTLSRSPEFGRGNPERQPPKRSMTVGTFGTSSIVQSQYADMVFEEVPRTHNLLSGLFTWIILAGFVVLPGTFSALEGIQSNSGEFEKVLHTMRHLPLLIIAFGFCGLGACGMCLLWWRWSHNYVWLLNSIFVPGTLNGLSGVISTFASIYGAQNGVYGASSIATLAVTGSCTVICGTLTVIYSLWKLDKIKRQHLREMAQVKTDGDRIGEVHYF